MNKEKDEFAFARATLSLVDTFCKYTGVHAINRNFMISDAQYVRDGVNRQFEVHHSYDDGFKVMPHTRKYYKDAFSSMGIETVDDYDYAIKEIEKKVEEMSSKNKTREEIINSPDISLVALARVYNALVLVATGKTPFTIGNEDIENNAVYGNMYEGFKMKFAQGELLSPITHHDPIMVKFSEGHVREMFSEKQRGVKSYEEIREEMKDSIRMSSANYLNSAAYFCEKHMMPFHLKADSIGYDQLHRHLERVVGTREEFAFEDRDGYSVSKPNNAVSKYRLNRKVKKSVSEYTSQAESNPDFNSLSFVRDELLDELKESFRQLESEGVVLKNTINKGNNPDYLDKLKSKILDDQKIIKEYNPRIRAESIF